jgi:hypothetical protein
MQIIALLTSVTEAQIKELTPIERQLLDDQLQRLRILCRVQDLKERGPQATFLDELKEGKGRE